ncbi:MAG: alpha-amylase family glycosyl hydrolase [Candidatus Nanopelagicaceae bacterium]
MKRKSSLSILVATLLALSSLYSISAASGASSKSTRVGLASDLIYFVMPDRYKDGDASNDNGAGFDPTSTAFFHGGDLKGLTGTCTAGDDGLVRIKKLGFTAVWLTPLVTQQPSTPHGAGYHGYWGVDFLNVDPHLGTNEDLGNFVACAKKLKLKIVLDVVTNHTGDIVKYQDQQAYVPVESTNAKNPVWLNELSSYHNFGDMSKCWGDGNCTKIGDFFGLDDLATEKESVWRGWGDVYGKWIKDYGISGFRVDTARHVDDEFFKNWSPLVQDAAKSVGISNFTVFGEVWEVNPVELMNYVRRNKIQTVLDFPFQRTATDFASGYSDAKVLENLFLSDDLYTSANSSANDLVTFLGNHDMGRSGYVIETKKEQPANQLLPRTKLANALMYLSRGIPVVYYGDEVGMTGTGAGNDQLARQDMFPTKIDAWKTETRIGGKPVGNGNSFTATNSNPIAQYLTTLSKLRSNNPGLANAVMQTRYAKNSVLVLSKKESKEKREYIVAFNNSTKPQTIQISTATSSGGWKVILGKTTFASSGSTLKLTVPALDTVVLKANKLIDRTEVKVGKIKVKEDYLTGFFQALAGIVTTDLLSVEFFYKSSMTPEWSSLGVDTNAPYSVFVDPQEHAGETLEIKAVATNSKGASFELSSTEISIPAS